MIHFFVENQISMSTSELFFFPEMVTPTRFNLFFTNSHRYIDDKMAQGLTSDDHHRTIRLPEVLQPYRTPTLSYVTSLVSTATTFPLDSLKTRMQSHPYNSALHCLRVTLRSEGLKGLFRGVTVPLVTSSISRSLGVSVYSYFQTPMEIMIRKGLSNEGNFDADTVGTQPSFGNMNSSKHAVSAIGFSSNVLAGLISGTCVSLFASPFELIKIFQQIIMVITKDSNTKIDPKSLPRSITQTAIDLFKYGNGPAGLYSGLRYHIMRDGICGGIFYATYDASKVVLKDNLYSNIQWVSVPLSGIIACIVAWVTVFPIDTTKSRYQRDVARNIIRVKSGLEEIPIKRTTINWFSKEMYRGLSPSITKAIFSTTMFFSGFEYLMAHVK